MFAWIENNPGLVTLIVIASIVSFIGTLVLVPAIVVRIPRDYFTHEHRPPSAWASHHPVIRWILLIAKNMLGALFMLAGIAMLVLPGQGLLSILVGFFLIDFPGKYGLEKWLVRRPRVRQVLDWVRRKAGRDALDPP